MKHTLGGSALACLVISTSLILTSCGSSSDSDSSKDTSGSAEGSTTTPQPFNASGFLGGPATPSFPDGDPDSISVVQIGPLDRDQVGSATLPIAFRNNTGEAVAHVDWTATARSGGSIVATASSQGTAPSQIAPGEVGLAYIYFDNAEAIPDGVDYEFTADSQPAGPTFFNTAPMTVTEVNIAGDAIVGSATNATGEKTEGPYSVSVYCFDGDNLTSEIGTYAEQDGPIDADGAVTFSARIYDDPCTNYIVGVSGYFSADD